MDDMENIMSIPDPGTAAGVVYLSLTHASSTHSTRFTIHLHHSTNNTANFAGQRLMSHLDQDMDICVQATATYHELSFYFQIRVGKADPLLEQEWHIGSHWGEVTATATASEDEYSITLLAWQIPLNAFSSLIPVKLLGFLTVPLLEEWGFSYVGEVYEYLYEYEEGDNVYEEEGKEVVEEEEDGDREGDGGDDVDMGEGEEDKEEDGTEVEAFITDDESMPDFDGDIGEDEDLHRELARMGL